MPEYSARKDLGAWMNRPSNGVKRPLTVHALVPTLGIEATAWNPCGVRVICLAWMNTLFI